jgi:hypothetical protein
MPGAAYGSTWSRVVSQRVPPTPKPASRRPDGTARTDSAVVMMMMGNTRMASVMPAEMTLRPPVSQSRPLTKTTSPRMP